MLIAIAHRLSTLVRSADTLARYAGDEFVFLCEDLHSSADAEILAARVEEAFESPFVLAGIGLTLAVTASIGIAFAGVGEGLSNELVVQADMAMYQVKRAGGAGHRIIDMQPFSLNSVSPTPKGEQ